MRVGYREGVREWSLEIFIDLRIFLCSGITSESAPEDPVIRDPGQGAPNSLPSKRRLSVPEWTKALITMALTSS